MMSLFFKFRLIFETVISLATSVVKTTVIYSGFKALGYFYKLGLRTVSILYYMSRRVETENQLYLNPFCTRNQKFGFTMFWGLFVTKIYDVFRIRSFKSEVGIFTEISDFY